MSRFISSACLFLLGVSTTMAQEVTVLKCELQKNTQDQWQVVKANFHGTPVGLPALIDETPKNYGGLSPRWDQMIYCTSIELTEQGEVRMRTLRMRQLLEKKCSEITDPEIVSIQVSFGSLLPSQSSFPFRYYDHERRQWQRELITYAGWSSEFADPALSAEKKCAQLAAEMPH